MTICKSQDQKLDNIIVRFDTASLGPGGVYVALSHVKTLNSIKFLTPLQMSHFHLVTFFSQTSSDAINKTYCNHCVSYHHRTHILLIAQSLPLLKLRPH